MLVVALLLVAATVCRAVDPLVHTVFGDVLGVQEGSVIAWRGRDRSLFSMYLHPTVSTPLPRRHPVRRAPSRQHALAAVDPRGAMARRHQRFRLRSRLPPDLQSAAWHLVCELVSGVVLR